MDNIDDTENVAMSPLPQKDTFSEQKTLTFPQAIQAVIDGKKITKLEWNDNGIYAFMGVDGYLKINLPQKLDNWTLRDVDMNGIDWVVLGEAN